MWQCNQQISPFPPLIILSCFKFSCEYHILCVFKWFLPLCFSPSILISTAVWTLRGPPSPGGSSVWWAVSLGCEWETGSEYREMYFKHCGLSWRNTETNCSVIVNLQRWYFCCLFRLCHHDCVLACYNRVIYPNLPIYCTIYIYHDFLIDTYKCIVINIFFPSELWNPS